MSGDFHVKVPHLGESISQGTILLINKKVGDFVEKGGLLFELETEKVTVEVAAESDGIISELFVKLNDVVKIGDSLATIKLVDDSKRPQEKSIVVENIPVKKSNTPAAQIAASPAAIKVANDNNLAIGDAIGTGRHGVILKEDLFAKKANQIIYDGKSEVIEFSEERKKFIKNSKAVDLNSFLFDQISFSGDQDILLPVFIKATAKAVENFPIFNAILSDTSATFIEDINIAANGLVVSRVQNLDCTAIQRILNDGNGNIVSSTLNIYHNSKVLLITPKIFNNHSAAISFGKVKDGKFYCGLSFDIKAIDEDLASDFMLYLKNLIETPHLVLFN